MGLLELQKLREQRDNPKPPKQRKPIAKVSAKRKKKLQEQKETLEKDAAFYKEIYNASPHKCQNCDCRLPITPSNFMFHHILEKRNYPQYRYVPENIAILCLECHSKCETNIEFAPRIKQRRLDAEKNHHKWEINEHD